LGGPGDEDPDTGVVGEDVGGQEDERGEDEQGQRKLAHLLQPASAPLILRPEFAGPSGAASAEARHGCCFVDRHRYPLVTDSSEIRAFDLHSRSGSQLRIHQGPGETLVVDDTLVAWSTSTIGGGRSPSARSPPTTTPIDHSILPR